MRICANPVIVSRQRGNQMANFAEKTLITLDCSVPYMSRRKLLRCGIPTSWSLGQMVDFATIIERHAHLSGASCLRNGLMLDFNLTTMGAPTDSFTQGNAQLIGLCDIVKCKCNRMFDAMAHSVKDRSHYCFQRLSSGKCTDEFVIKTAGVKLFPRYYADIFQHTK